MLVEEGAQRLEHEQRRAAVSLPLRRGLDDVIRCDRRAHRPERYKDRNLLCAEVSQATMPRIRTLLLSSLAAALLAACAGAVQALASQSQITYFEASADLLSPSTRHHTIEQLQHLGVKALRVELKWNEVAPGPTSATKPSFEASNPGSYNWGPYATLLAEAKQLGWPVLLTVTAPAPRWATANLKAPYITRPDDEDFKEFMTAVARELGSEVSVYAIWNEPNEPVYLLPQWQSNGKPASGASTAGYTRPATKACRRPGWRTRECCSAKRRRSATTPSTSARKVRRWR